MLCVALTGGNKASAAEIVEEVYAYENGKYICKIEEESDLWQEKEAYILKNQLAIPEEVLKDISTENLLELVLNYHYLSDVLYYTDFNVALKTMSEQFNGIKELCARQNVGNVVAKYYLDYTLEGTLTSFAQTCFIEGLLTQSNILNNINTTDLKQLAICMNYNSLIKKDMFFFHTSPEYWYDNLDAGQFALIESKTGIELNSSAETSRIMQVGTVLSSSDPYAVPITGPNNEEFILRDRSSVSDFTLSEATDFDMEMVYNYGCTVQETSTKKYNCHYFAYIYSSGWSGYSAFRTKTYSMPDNQVYLTIPYSYLRVSSGPTAVDQVLLYNNGSSVSASSPVHSAVAKVIVSGNISSTTYLSKFGDGPLATHTLTQSPYYTESSNYLIYKKNY